MHKIINNSFLITGGTGSFGKALCGKLAEMKLTNVTIYSRDKKAQELMAITFPFFRYVTGDITDRERLSFAMSETDYVIHAAAMKDVSLCERYPGEAARINITGTEVVLECARKCGVKKLLAISTDKAVNPQGVMGMTKAIMESLVRSAALEAGCTSLSIVRFGNLSGSAGTVIPLFIKQATEGKILTVTDPEMTRFLMTPEESAEYALFTLLNSVNGDLFLKLSHSVSVGSIAKAVLETVKGAGSFTREGYLVTGARPGEKSFETMATAGEMSASEVIEGKYLRIPLLKNKNEFKHPCKEEYNSSNAQRMTDEELTEIISDIRQKQLIN